MLTHVFWKNSKAELENLQLTVTTLHSHSARDLLGCLHCMQLEKRNSIGYWDTLWGIYRVGSYRIFWSLQAGESDFHLF